MKRGIFIIACLILIALPVYAAEETTFEETSDIILPPPPPDEGISPKNDLLFLLRDADTREVIGNIHTIIDITDLSTGEGTTTLQYVGDDGVLSLQLEPSEYEIDLRIDVLETEGKDYYASIDQTVDSTINRTLSLFAVGSIIGTVYDERGNVVPDARVRFSCTGNYGITADQVTDDFGAFSSFWLPTGACRVSALSGRKVGYEDISINKGDLLSVDIHLTKGRASVGGMIPVLVGVLIVVILIVVFTLMRSRRRYQPPPAKPVLSPRSRDIVKTLKDKERKVVEFLLDNPQSTQARIRHAVGMPKTSVARILMSLELKNIVKVKRVGKLKKVELTPWFLGKEEMDDN
jgi:uncharacterized membrane protein